MPEPTPPSPWVHPRDLMLASDVRRLCKIRPEDRHTMQRWRASKDFPEPIRTIKQGRSSRANVVEIWDRRDVKAWLKANPPLSTAVSAPPEPPAPEMQVCPECGTGSYDGSMHLAGCSRLQ